MTFNDRWSRWAAVLALGTAGLIGVGAATVSAGPAAPSAASTFELTLEVEERFTGYGIGDEVVKRQGTFRSRAPFCTTGTWVDLGSYHPGHATWRFTCDAGAGSLTVFIVGMGYPGAPRWSSTWRIENGSGSYASLRGLGSLQGEVLGHEEDGAENVVTWRSTLQGVAADDAVAPTVALSSVRVARLPRPAGAYGLDVTIALRDDVEGSPVSYLLRVTPTMSARELARSFGTTRDGSVSMTMRIRYYKPQKRVVLLRLSASDEVGNESSLNRVLRLPR